MTNGRISDDKEEAGTFVKNADLHLNAEDGTTTRGEILGMTPDELTKLTGFKTKAFSGNPLLPGVLDAQFNPLKQNKETTVKANEWLREFGDWMRPIIVRISGSPFINDTDRLVLNIAIPGSHSTPSGQIIVQCIAQITPLGDCQVQTKCYTSQDAKRAGLPEGADGVQVASRVDLVELEKDEEGHDIPGKVVQKSISSASECTTKDNYSSASFIHKVEGASPKDTVHFFHRWINTKHPERNGPWTGPTSTPLL